MNIKRNVTRDACPLYATIIERIPMSTIQRKNKPVVMPGTQKILEQVGEQIRLARLRRKLSVELVAERAGVSRTSVWAVEKGSPSVAMGIYANILAALGLREDLLFLAGDDPLGHDLQDMELKQRIHRS